MKMKYSMWEKSTQKFRIIESKTEAKAFDFACKQFGVNGFFDFKRYYLDENLKQHKMSFLKKAISNVSKHLHKEQRKGLS